MQKRPRMVPLQEKDTHLPSFVRTCVSELGLLRRYRRVIQSRLLQSAEKLSTHDRQQREKLQSFIMYTSPLLAKVKEETVGLKEKTGVASNGSQTPTTAQGSPEIPHVDPLSQFDVKRLPSATSIDAILAVLGTRLSTYIDLAKKCDTDVCARKDFQLVNALVIAECCVMLMIWVFMRMLKETPSYLEQARYWADELAAWSPYQVLGYPFRQVTTAVELGDAALWRLSWYRHGINTFTRQARDNADRADERARRSAALIGRLLLYSPRFDPLPKSSQYHQPPSDTSISAAESTAEPVTGKGDTPHYTLADLTRYIQAHLPILCHVRDYLGAPGSRPDIVRGGSFPIDLGTDQGEGDSAVPITITTLRSHLIREIQRMHGEPGGLAYMPSISAIPSPVARYSVPLTVTAFGVYHASKRSRQAWHWIRDAGSTIHDFLTTQVVKPTLEIIDSVRIKETPMGVISEESLSSLYSIFESMGKSFAEREGLDVETFVHKVRHGDIAPVEMKISQTIANGGPLKFFGSTLQSDMWMMVNKYKLLVEEMSLRFETLLRSNDLNMKLVAVIPALFITYLSTRAVYNFSKYLLGFSTTLSRSQSALAGQVRTSLALVERELGLASIALQHETVEPEPEGVSRSVIRPSQRHGPLLQSEGYIQILLQDIRDTATRIGLPRTQHVQLLSLLSEIERAGVRGTVWRTRVLDRLYRAFPLFA